MLLSNIKFGPNVVATVLLEIVAFKGISVNDFSFVTVADIVVVVVVLAVVGETVSSFATTRVVLDVCGQSETAGTLFVGTDDTDVVNTDENVVDDDDGIAGDADDAINTDNVVADISGLATVVVVFGVVAHSP